MAAAATYTRRTVAAAASAARLRVAVSGGFRGRRGKVPNPQAGLRTRRAGGRSFRTTGTRATIASGGATGDGRGLITPRPSSCGEGCPAGAREAGANVPTTRAEVTGYIRANRASSGNEGDR